MARSKKHDLIDKTYELLHLYSPDEITIRLIADAAGCTSTVIYRHFENLDHLLLIASIRFLEDYIKSLGDLLNNENDSLDMLIRTWQLFAEQSFYNVEIFDLLFWGKFKEQLSDAIVQYYQIFPNAWQNLSGMFAVVFFSSNIEERNFLVVQRAASEGYFPFKGIKTFSDIQCYMFHGLLLEYRDKYRDERLAEEGISRFMNMLELIIEQNRLK